MSVGFYRFTNVEQIEENLKASDLHLKWDGKIEYNCGEIFNNYVKPIFDLSDLIILN